MLLTIFTPTFNRAKTLTRTFESLCAQTCFDFEWLIVDDGSTDQTDILVEDFVKKASFPIRYIRKANGGKHTAYNKGLELARGDYFFTLDSDDWLPINSVELIAKEIERIKNQDNIAGIIALKEYPDGNLIGKKYPSSLNVSSLFDLENQGLQGERSLVFKTEIAKQYPFPIIKEEKFMTENVVYDKIGLKYEFAVSNEVLTTCEYQIDGLSSAPYKTILNNAGGYSIYYGNRIDIARSFKLKLKNTLCYHAMIALSSYEYYRYKGSHRLFVSLLKPLGYLGKLYYIRKAK